MTLCCANNRAYAQSDFYSLDHIPDIRLYFQQSNWDFLLDSLYLIGSEARLGGDVIIDGTLYSNVGVRYKGYSSYSSSRDKNPFNIDLNYALPDQNHQGIQKIKLSNVIQDPSFVREVLSYEIARKYMPSSKANYANVFVNDTLIGVYTNVQPVDGDFLQSHFYSSENTFVKCNPETVDLNGGNANLSNAPGTNLYDYESLYDMKSSGDYDWTNLYGLIDVLNEDIGSVESLLNVDRTLWMHALNYVLINFDSYVGYAQNYYLYQDNNLQFQPILWDMNMSFASYRLSDDSDNWDGFTIEEAKTIDPLQHFNSFSVHARPLLRNLFENDTYRRMYLAHIKTIVEENLVNQDYYTRAAYMQSIVDASVYNDSNKFYGYDDFVTNLDTTVNDLVDYPGIKDLMEGRSTYLMNYPGMDDAPELTNIIENSPSDQSHEDLWISVKVNSSLPTSVYFAFRETNTDLFQVVSMFDDGAHGDGSVNDSVYGVYFSDPSPYLQYYIYAENDSAGMFAPRRAAYEFYELKLRKTTRDITINEVMLENQVVEDDFDEQDPWLELFVQGSSKLNLADLQISVNQESPWTLTNRVVSENEYYTIWLDEQSTQGSNHAPFYIAIGDTVYLRNSDGTVIDSTIVLSYDGVTSFARYPNGTGDFKELLPTHNKENIDATQALFTNTIFVYPNPASDEVTVRLNSNKATLSILALEGKVVLLGYDLQEGANIIDTSQFAQGVYLLRVSEENQEAIIRLVIN